MQATITIIDHEEAEFNADYKDEVITFEKEQLAIDHLINNGFELDDPEDSPFNTTWYKHNESWVQATIKRF